MSINDMMARERVRDNYAQAVEERRRLIRALRRMYYEPNATAYKEAESLLRELGADNPDLSE